MELKVDLQVDIRLIIVSVTSLVLIARLAALLLILIVVVLAVLLVLIVRVLLLASLWAGVAVLVLSSLRMSGHLEEVD
jgi:hypothetical protein